MNSGQTYVRSVNKKRRFVCSPVAVLGFIVNEREEILLLGHPDQAQGWQVVNGAMEAGETPQEAVLRETIEEAGGDIRVRPLGTVHVSSFHYDEKVQFMLSIGYLLAYEGGEIVPGDDMAGSEYRWWSLDEILSDDIKLIIPPDEKWMVKRAVELSRLWWRSEDVREPSFNLTVRGKTKA
jgi:8-oxo-dGTP pyrophosphatase MutT (NUDIX family)